MPESSQPERTALTRGRAIPPMFSTLARGCAGLAFEIGTLDAAVTEVTRGEVHDRPAQVRAEGRWLPQVAQPPHEARERVLDQILGQGSVTCQQEGEPDAVGACAT
jgi:hypothetical protein